MACGEAAEPVEERSHRGILPDGEASPTVAEEAARRLAGLRSRSPAADGTLATTSTMTTITAKIPVAVKMTWASAG